MTCGAVTFDPLYDNSNDYSEVEALGCVGEMSAELFQTCQGSVTDQGY